MMEYSVKMVTSEADREQVFNVRKVVFVDEQLVPEDLEYDQYDQQADVEQFMISTQAGKVIGTARLRSYAENSGKVQRVAILAEYRGTGAGALLMEAVEKMAKDKGFHMLQLDGQLQARYFYERLGYHATGEVFLDANIEHISMAKKMI